MPKDEVMQRLSLSHLQSILDCGYLDDLRNIPEIDADALIAKVNLAGINIAKRNAKSHAILAAINYSTYPFDAWWLIESITGIALFGSWAIPITITMICIGLMVGGVFFHDTYKKTKQKKEETIKFFQLAILQLQVLDELFKKKGQRFTYYDEKPVKGSGIKIGLSKKTSFSQRKSIFVGIGASFTLGLFFLGIGSLLVDSLGIALASALVGPVGWPIALAGLTIAIGLGIYLAHKHFQAQKAKYVVKTAQEKIMNRINSGREEYEKIKSVPEDSKELEQSVLPVHAQETQELSIVSIFAVKAVQEHCKSNNENKQYGSDLAPKNKEQIDQWWHRISKLSFFKPRSKATHKLDEVVKEYSQGKKSLSDLQDAITVWKEQQILSASERCEAVQRLEKSIAVQR